MARTGPHVKPLDWLRLTRLMNAVQLTVSLCLPMAATAQRAIPDELIIVMARGNCEGGCPVYRIMIFGSGDVVWQGRAGVGHPGVAQGMIGPDAIRGLINDFESVGYFGLQDIYGYRGSGCRESRPYMPMVLLEYSIDGQSRTLLHHSGCVGEVSGKLTALEDDIDRVVQAQRWITGKALGKPQQKSCKPCQ